jgi:hypothetical protein
MCFILWALVSGLVSHKDGWQLERKPGGTGNALVGGFSVSEGKRELLGTMAVAGGLDEGGEGARGCRGWVVSPFGHSYADWEVLFFYFSKIRFTFSRGGGRQL